MKTGKLNALFDLTVGVFLFAPVKATPAVWALESFVSVVSEPSSPVLAGSGVGASLFFRRPNLAS